MVIKKPSWGGHPSSASVLSPVIHLGDNLGPGYPLSPRHTRSASYLRLIRSNCTHRPCPRTDPFVAACTYTARPNRMNPFYSASSTCKSTTNKECLVRRPTHPASGLTPTYAPTCTSKRLHNTYFKHMLQKHTSTRRFRGRRIDDSGSSAEKPRWIAHTPTASIMENLLWGYSSKSSKPLCTHKNGLETRLAFSVRFDHHHIRTSQHPVSAPPRFFTEFCFFPRISPKKAICEHMPPPSLPTTIPHLAWGGTLGFDPGRAGHAPRPGQSP